MAAHVARSTRFGLAVVGLLVIAASSPPPSGTRLLSRPAISQRNVAFVYAGDLWVASVDGSNPRRLTSEGGIESSPAFSPDGRMIAFSAQYDGNVDVYVMSVDGGAPTRLTWHPGRDIVQGFTPDGEGVLFTSPRAAFTPSHTKLYVVPVKGGVPQELRIPNANKATYSPDGRQVAYNPLPQAFTTWKHYRGGRTSTIWIFNSTNDAAEAIPQPQGRSNDTDPMWSGTTIYFRSDRAGEFNLFSYDTRTKTVKQLTRFDDFPVIDASMGAGKVVYERSGYIYTFDPVTSQTQQLPISVATDLVETRPRYVKGARYIRGFALSPTGARAAFEFRGEIVTVPAEKGDARDITNTPGANDKVPLWSPDGTRIAYFTDESGEYELQVRNQTGLGTPQRYKLTGAGIYERMSWAPDGSRIAYVDISQTLYLLDLKTSAVSKVASDPIVGQDRTLAPVWSPDSKWVAYALTNRSYIHRAYAYSIDQNRSFPISDGLSDVITPGFDKSGKYMYLLASTDAGPVRQWFLMSNADPRSEYSIYVTVLRKDLPSPLPHESDEERDTSVMALGPQLAGAPRGGGSTGGDAAVHIDFDDLPQRIVALPLPAGSYRSLQPGAAGEIYYLRTLDGVSSLQRFTLATRRAETVVSPANDFTISADGKKILYRAGTNWFIVSTTRKPDANEGRLKTDSIAVLIDPRAEWKQQFDEAWRINRDLFYDPNMHGANWPAIREKYSAFLPDLTSRSDLTRVLTWMVSELVVGHHSASGGPDLREQHSVAGGLLGADYAVENGRYRFKQVYGGLNWNPELRAPLTEPGVNAKAGEYLLAVNGRDLRPPTSVYAPFENTAGKIVQITIGPNADGTGARTVSVVPVADEGALRNRAWVEHNLHVVDSATGGHVAYVYVPNTSNLGHDYFKRYFYPQSDRDAIIVDERFNGGGLIADYYIDMLRKPYIAHWAMRYGEDLKTPTASIQGPKVLLIDEMAGSGGDLFPYMWRKFAMGPMVGKRTWGGLVGHWTSVPLMDGGIGSPDLGIWTTDEGFVVEDVGVPPDIEVEQTPALVIGGHDPQLERAIEVVKAELKKTPPPSYKRPPFPTRAKP